MSNEALKPCPFPHNEPYKQLLETKRHNYGDERPRRFFVRCCVCNARGPYTNSKEEAKAAWNKRAEEASDD
jgi:hypothetical protein